MNYLYRISGIQGIEWWNGTLEWNTGMSLFIPINLVSGIRKRKGCNETAKVIF